MGRTWPQQPRKPPPLPLPHWAEAASLLQALAQGQTQAAAAPASSSSRRAVTPPPHPLLSAGPRLCRLSPLIHPVTLGTHSVRMKTHHAKPPLYPLRRLSMNSGPGGIGTRALSWCLLIPLDVGSRPLVQPTAPHPTALRVKPVPAFGRPSLISGLPPPFTVPTGLTPMPEKSQTRPDCQLQGAHLIVQRPGRPKQAPHTEDSVSMTASITRLESKPFLASSFDLVQPWSP